MAPSPGSACSLLWISPGEIQSDVISRSDSRHFSLIWLLGVALFCLFSQYLSCIFRLF